MLLKDFNSILFMVGLIYFRWEKDIELLFLEVEVIVLESFFWKGGDVGVVKNINRCEVKDV